MPADRKPDAHLVVEFARQLITRFAESVERQTGERPDLTDTAFRKRVWRKAAAIAARSQAAKENQS